MDFIIDRQTLEDLEIFERKRDQKSLFKFFDKPTSHGGKEELLKLFQHPLSDRGKIKERQDVIRYMFDKKLSFTIDRHSLDYIEYYLIVGNKPVKLSRLDAWHKAIKYWLRPINEIYIIHRGIEYVLEFLQELYAIATDDSELNRPSLLAQQYQFIAESIRNSELRRIIGFKSTKKISVMDRERFDYTFRYKEYDRLRDILQTVYLLEAFQVAAHVTAELGLVFPEITDSKEIEMTGLYHLFVENAVVNDIRYEEEKNIHFITGANMAGKSTFLKAFGIAVFLAHIGFPAPVASMRTGVFNGLFSTINIADNLNKGYSHFYSEVLRVKNVANEINRTKNMVVIFDELFRGTNVKDAYDASLAVISAFAEVKGSIFLVSTHIVEVAEPLRAFKNIRFGYFHTAIKEEMPIYSYQLRDGVTEERLGMLIIKKERIIETIRLGMSISPSP